jgi:hypothetical protein
VYTPSDIEDFYSDWRGFYLENDDRGESCINYSFGEQWDPSIVQDRALRGEESLMFNIASKHLLRVKGEAEKLDLSLVIKGDNLDPKLLREGRHVLNRLVLCNDHLSAFERVLNQVYDYGYGALLVTTKRASYKDPSEEPYLSVIKDPRKVFFDPNSEDDFKTEGRYCGIRYSIPKKQLRSRDSRKNQRWKEDESVDAIDFWYREPFEEPWFFTQKGEWVQDYEGSFLIKKKVSNVKVKFMRIVDGEVTEGPIDYYTDTKLPLIYWKGLEGILRYGGSRKVKTLPFVYNLVDAQAFTNYVGSALVGRLKKLGGTKVILTDQMIEGKENFWNDFNRRTGVLQVNESDEGQMQQPLILNAETLDANLLNALQMSLQLMDQLAGINLAQQGQQQGVATNAGLHRQIMQGNILQNVILSHHLRAINEVGRVLREMIPNVIIEQRNLGEGLTVNAKEATHTPSSPEIRNDIKELFSGVDFSIEYGASSDAEKAANLIAIKEILSTNPNISQYFADEFAANLNTANSDKLRRRMEALMPPYIREVGEGNMSIEEYHEMIKQQQEEAQKQPTLEQQQLELQKAKIQGDQQIKQQEMALKQAKLQEQAAKDAQNLKIKEGALIAKMQPKEMIYEKESKR